MNQRKPPNRRTTGPSFSSMRKGLVARSTCSKPQTRRSESTFPLTSEAPCAAKERSPPRPELSDVLLGYDLDFVDGLRTRRFAAPKLDWSNEIKLVNRGTTTTMIRLRLRRAVRRGPVVELVFDISKSNMQRERFPASRAWCFGGKRLLSVDNGGSLSLESSAGDGHSDREDAAAVRMPRRTVDSVSSGQKAGQ